MSKWPSQSGVSNNIYYEDKIDNIMSKNKFLELYRNFEQVFSLRSSLAPPVIYNFQFLKVPSIE